MYNLLQTRLTKVELEGYEDCVCTVIPNVLTPSECEEWIKQLDGKFEPACVTNALGQQVVNEKIRKCKRVMIHDDTDKMALLWDRCKPGLPSDAVSLNPLLRFVRYDPGDYFKPHHDFLDRIVLPGHHSRYTLQLYLNDTFVGGELTFYGRRGEWTVDYQPIQGCAIIFDQDLLHSGDLLKSGVKYSVRTDILVEDTDDYSRSHA